MSETNLTVFNDTFEDDDCTGDNSDDGLRIVIDSPESKGKVKSKSINIDRNEKQMIESVENEIEKVLEEKAAKANLTASNVKNILKHVVTNEHVLAMVRQAEDPANLPESLRVYEPKLTRAKAKQLYSSQTVAPIPWISQPKPPLEVQALISEELPEDSSDDEYIPAEGEIEDDRECSFNSENEPLIVHPPTPKNIINTDSSTQTNWSDDGVFKVPHLKTTPEVTEEANIARRTRSKLCLSSTPLEVIEEAFIPPDITTDMYDMDCDDDDWRDFLKKFTRPLDEVIKPAEDDEHDPEYNVLADEEIDKVDKEELRADKGVKVTKKELNELVAELFEYAHNFTGNPTSEIEIDPQPQFTILDVQIDQNSQNTASVKNTQQEVIPNTAETEPGPQLIEVAQKDLLQQQMRQHVQLLTQSFLLAYDHPEYADIASKCKEYLYNLKYLPGDKENSYFAASNLNLAIKLMEDWQSKFSSNDEEVKSTKQFVTKVLMESKLNRNAGIKYIPTFPPLVLETISKSNVFLYPSLLPRVPFKTTSLYVPTQFNSSENELIAIGLEQFIPLLREDVHHITPKGDVRLKHVCHYIQRYMIPPKDVIKIYKHVLVSRCPSSEPNPIKYYFQFQKAPVTIHYVVGLNELGVAPPCQRKSDQLPHQWKQYIYPNEQNTVTCDTVPVYSNTITKVAKPPVYNKNFVNRRHLSANKSATTKLNLRKRRTRTEKEEKQKLSVQSDVPFNDFFRSSLCSSTPKCKPKKLEQYFNSPIQTKKPLTIVVNSLNELKFNSSIFKRLNCAKVIQESENMLPSMPSLNTPIKRSPERSTISPELDVNKPYLNENSILTKPGNVCGINLTCSDSGRDCGKDSIDDINALMAASSTIKPAPKKKLSVAEKKKAKLHKELMANLSMVTPEDPKVTKEKINMFVQAYYEKLQEQLDLQDYHRIMVILNEFDEDKGSVPDLYKNVNKILQPRYPDLADEFLIFLTPAQAKAVGKLVPHVLLNSMSQFLRKLEMYFKEQPSQVRKIYRSLTELANCVDVTMDKVKSTILPLLKGNTLLTDWFLQIFPCEKPPKSLLSGPFETIEIGRDSAVANKEDVFETVVVPDVEDPYGGPNCICACHNVEDQAFINRSRHCIPCGTKFLQGRIYVHTGKGLRLAKITFNSNSDIDHFARLCGRPAVQPKRKTEASSGKRVSSPNKEAHDDIRANNESEDDVESGKKKNQKIAKTPRKRQPRKTTKPSKTAKEKTEIVQATTNKSEKSGNTKKSSKTVSAENSVKNAIVNVNEPVKLLKQPESTARSVVTNINEPLKLSKQPDLPNNEGKSDLILTVQKPSSEDVMDWECNTSIGAMELRLSLNADSECDEIFQESIKSYNNLREPQIPLLQSKVCHSVSWTREEDKIILETFQREGNREETFILVSQRLQNRSIARIRERFETLMNLLEEMAASSSSS